jgi:diketogulonate reductase-like aldo/keto reductase
MPDITRRHALALGMGTLAACLLDLSALAQDSMLERVIPVSGEKLPVIGLGTYRTFDVSGRGKARNDAREVLKVFAENGGKVVDSSPMYGKAEGAVGDLAAELNLHSRLFLATKVWTSGREAGERQMQESMGKLRTQRIDLMQVHNLLDAETHLATLRNWKEQGKIRYLGVTHYHEGAYDELKRTMERHPLDFIQINYSMAEREAEQYILPMAAERRVAVLINRPFAQADLFDRVRGKQVPEWAQEFDCRTWAQLFLKYIVAHPAVTCVLPATRNPEHLRDNLNAGRGRLPEPKQRERMLELVK